MTPCSRLARWLPWVSQMSRPEEQNAKDRDVQHTHTEAPEPMAGAVVARYDALSSACGRANEKALKSGRQISQGATQRVVEAEARHCAKSCRQS